MPGEVDTTLRKDMPVTDKATEAASKLTQRARVAAMDPSGAQYAAAR